MHVVKKNDAIISRTGKKNVKFMANKLVIRQMYLIFEETLTDQPSTL